MALPPLDPQKKKNLLLGTLLLVVVAYFGYDYLYKPRAEEVAALETRLAEIQAANSRARAITRGGEGDMEGRLSAYRQQLDLVEGLIPSNEELPDLLDAISAEAQRTGVQISLIQPVGATEEAYYTRRVYDMAVIGEYHQIGDFLTRVASLPRIVTPTSLVLTTRPPVEDEPQALEARFSIETYVIPNTPS